MNCNQTYKTYKENCKIIYSGLVCTSYRVDNMNTTELTLELLKIKKLHNDSKKCLELRKSFKYKCVDKDKRDKAHDHEINKTKNYFNICQIQLKKINERFKQLEDEFKTLTKLKIDISTLTTSGDSESDSGVSST